MSSAANYAAGGYMMNGGITNGRFLGAPSMTSVNSGSARLPGLLAAAARNNRGRGFATSAGISSSLLKLGAKMMRR
jgi:hypothetical protein